MHLFTSVYSIFTLHVSNGYTIHHQELLNTVSAVVCT